MDWLSWLDKKNRTINDDFPKGKPPHIDYNKTPDKTIPRTIRAFEDEKDDDPMVYDHKTASETIFNAISLKLDLMKDLNTRDSRSLVPTIPKKEEQEFQEQSTTARMGSKHVGLDYEDTPKTGSSPKGTGTGLQTSDTWQGGQEDSEYRKITNPEYTDDGKGVYDIQSAPKRKRGTPKVDPRMRKENPIKTIPKTASWESWLDKNNGIERDHKKEDKHEWDGKFSSSTIRDDAENDDDKAIGEEESLEELTDGKLEEIEKLKSWEVFLKANLNQYPDDNPPQETDKDGDTIINYETGTKLNTDGTTTDPKNRKIEDESSSDNLTDRYRKGGAGRKEDDTGKGGRGRKGGQSRGGGSSGEGEISYQDTERNSDGSHNVTEQGTRAEMRHFNKLPKLEESVKPSKVGAINSTQPASDDDKALADTQDVGTTPVGDVSTPPSHTTPKTPDSIRKLPTSVTPKIASWEVFLEKGLAGAKKVPLTHRDPDPEETDVDKIMSNAELAGKTIQQKRASWEEWVEKMQGAGDARYGNQHLTGMEQHPVADDESMELSAETDENNEKDDKKEDREGKDNKPYKALSHE